LERRRYLAVEYLLLRSSAAQSSSQTIQEDPAYEAKYDKVIQEYLSLGHAILVKPSDPGTIGRVWYLQHHVKTATNKPE
jgi:uncharacterized protein (UPF0303 family)